MTTRRKRKTRIKIRGVLRLALILAVISFVIVKMIQWNITDENVTYNVAISEISTSENYKGIIVRNEYSYSVNFSGKLSQLASEGDRVKKNQRIMNIVRGEENSNAVDQVDELLDIPNIISKEDIKTRINNIEEDIATAIKNENYDLIPELAIDLSLQIEALKTKNDTKEVPGWVQSVGSESIRVGENMSEYAKRAGIITYYIDGYEDYLTYERVINSQIEKYLEMDIDPVSAGDYDVEQGDVIYKIIDDSEYYIIVIADKSAYQQYELYSDVVIETENQEVVGVIEKYIPAGDKIAIAIKVTSYIDGFQKKRLIDVTIKQKSFKGLEVKSSSIVDIDKGLGVYVVNKDGKVIFKPIQIIYNNGDTVLVKRDVYYDFNSSVGKQIETISLHDRIINIGENFKEGDTIK